MRFAFVLLCAAAVLSGQTKRRSRSRSHARGTTGPFKAISDVTDVEIGHRPLTEDDSTRTGVTAVWPLDKSSGDPVFGGCFSQNPQVSP